jgi:hypothetical protein
MNQWNFLFCLWAPKKDILIVEECHLTDNWTKGVSVVCKQHHRNVSGGEQKVEWQNLKQKSHRICKKRTKKGIIRVFPIMTTIRKKRKGIGMGYKILPQSSEEASSILLNCPPKDLEEIPRVSKS